MTPVRRSPYGLTGSGVYVAVIDTGIDVYHPDFIDREGNTRIEVLWDQTIPGNPPKPYNAGTVYSRQEINEYLQNTTQRIPSRDTNGHGTHVASICAGNQGVAPESELIVVKLGRMEEGGFPRTTQLMTAIDFVISYARRSGRPVAVNLSYGNNYGDHRGTSLLETYISQMADQWQNVICIGTGNEGDTGRHRHGIVLPGQNLSVAMDVAPSEPDLSLQLWKEYTDDFRITLISPEGQRRQILDQEGATFYEFGTTRVNVYYGQPVPYNVMQEIYFSFVPEGNTIAEGVWEILLENTRGNGEYAMWLPVSSGTNTATKFLEPSADWTLTIPSTSTKSGFGWRL